MTDDDVAAISTGFRVYAAGSAEIPAVSEADARAAFVAYMNETCAYLGLENSNFVNASGLTRSSVSCPLDELKLAITAAGNPVACDLWSTKSRDFYIGGVNPRTISVTNNVYSADDNKVDYKMLGGKGGSLKTESESYWRKARIGLYNVNDTLVAVALMGPGEWIFGNMPVCTNELLNMMADKLNGNTPIEGTNLAKLVTQGGGYAAVPVPNAAQAYRNSYSASDLLTIENALHNNDTTSQVPASTSKTVTMLCALRVISDFQEVITITSGDVLDGSGSTFASGDKVTIEEALRIMMMESSNTMAEAIGRIVGTKILLANSTKG
jgi:D-alanyl-D-alanine carboxypeptidase